MDRVVMEHTPMSIGQGSDHGNDSEPESAVSEDLNDDDHDYEVDAIKWAIWRDSRKDRPDGFVGWHYWIMWKNYLKSQSDSEEPNSAFAEEDGKIPLLIAFWESFNRDDLRPLPGESEPAAPPKGSRNKRIQTPEAQLKKWLNATNRKRLYSTYMLRKKWEETHPGQIVPKKFSDYYSWRKRKNRKSTERLASVAASVAGSTTGQSAPTVPSTSAEPVAGIGKGKGKAKIKPGPIAKPKVKQPKPIKPKTTEQEKSAPGSLKVKIAVPQKTIPSGLASREGSTFSGDISDLPEGESHSAFEEAGPKSATATLAPRGLNKGKRKAEDEVPPPKDTSSTTASSIPAKRKKTTPMATPPPQSQSQPQLPPQPQVPPMPTHPLIHENRWTGLNKIPIKSAPALDSDPNPRFGDPEPGIFAPTQAQRSASMSEMSFNAAGPSGPRPPVKPPVKSSSYCPRPTAVVNTVPTQTFTDEPLSIPFESPAEIDGNDLPGISWNAPNNASSAERPVSHSVETSPYTTDRPLPSVIRSKSPSSIPAPIIDMSFSPPAQSSALPAVEKPPLTARPKYQHPSRIRIMPTVDDPSVVVRPQGSPRKTSLTRGSAEAMSRSPSAGVTPSQPPLPSPTMGNQSQPGGTFAPPPAAPAKRQPGRPLGSKNSRKVSAEGPSPAPSPPITRPIPIFDLSKNQPARPAAPSNRIESSSAISDPPVLPKGLAGPTKASIPPAPFKLTRPVDQPPKPGRPVAPAQSIAPGAGAFGSRPASVEQRTQSNALAASPSASAPPFKLAERAASTSQPAKPTEPVPPGPGAFGSRPASVEQPTQPQSRAAQPPAPAIPSSTLKQGVPDGQPLNPARSTNSDSGAIDSASVSSDPPAPAKKSAAPPQALAFPPPFKLSPAGQPRHPTPPTNPGSAGFGSAPVHPEPPTHSAIASTYNASADPRRRSVPVSATPSIASPQHSVDEQTPAPPGNAPDPRSKLPTPPASPVKRTSQQLSDTQTPSDYGRPIRLCLVLPKGKWMDPSYTLKARVSPGSLSSAIFGNHTHFLFGPAENSPPKYSELAFAQVDTVCLDGMFKLGATMTEWAAVTKLYDSAEWDELEARIGHGRQCMVAYTEVTGYRKIPTHYALILTSPEVVDLSPIGIGQWRSESLPSIILLWLVLPKNSPAAPSLPNPVRPAIKDREESKSSYLDTEPLLLRTYGLDLAFMKRIKGKKVIVSPSMSSWERLHYFMTVELEKVLLSPVITSDILPRGTAIYSFGPSIERYPSQWRLRRIWQSGGLVTFSPTFILQSPEQFLEIMGIIRSSPDWATYIIPSVVEWLAESWDKPNRCPQPIAAYEAVCSSLFLDEDLLELSGDLVTEGGGLAVSCAPPVIHDTRGCATWIDWLHATYEQRTFEGLVELCRGIRPEHFACHNKFDGTSTPLTQIDVEIAQGSDMMGMRLRPEIVPYRRYIYIGPVSMKSDQQNKAVEYVHPDDFAAIFSGAV